MLLENTRGGYRFVRGIGPYSAGIGAAEGFTIEHVRAFPLPSRWTPVSTSRMRIFARSAVHAAHSARWRSALSRALFVSGFRRVQRRLRREAQELGPRSSTV